MTAAAHTGVLAKFADYCILAANYDKERKLVEVVRAKSDGGRTLGAGQDMTRAEILEAVKLGQTFVTAVKNEVQVLSQGKPISVTKIKGVEYLKTVDDGRPCDTLENVPGY